MVVTASALAACGSAADPGTRTDAGPAHHRAGHHRHGQQSATSRPPRARSVGGGVREVSTGQGPHHVGKQRPGEGSTPAAATHPAAANAKVSDRTGDTDGSGTTPAYADLALTSLRERGPAVLVTFTTAGAIPRVMPDGDTHASYGLELTPSGGQAIDVYVDADQQGWTAYLTRGHRRQDLSTPAIVGRTVAVELPAAVLGRARHWQWRSESSWLQSGVLATSYAFDSAPDLATARFDRG